VKVYIEEIEELSAHGVTTYSLVQGMNVYRADVRASGIEIVSRNMDTGESTPLGNNSEKYKELVEALTPELYKEK
jgi:hypothetical protein